MFKKWIKLGLITILVFMVLTACKIQSVEEYQKEEQASQTESTPQDTNQETTIAKEEKKEKTTKNKIEATEKKKEDIEKKEDTEKKQTTVKKEKNTSSVSNDQSKTKEKNNPKTEKETSKQKEKTSKPVNKGKDSKPPKTGNQTATKPTKPTNKVTPGNENKPKKKYVTISIRVDTILKNYDKLDPSLRSEQFVPKNGVILNTTKYELKGKENVFDILVRATRDHRIHMEYQGASENQYGSVYIEGINHVYEFSVGELSGWMYSVNSWYPNYGASKYYLEDGDKIEWNYTCDLGRDLGVTWDE
ncbi:hypothetical protein J6TS2_52180 [Heyndrickxia sporothermodurans]|nr:hypothetical protein J6TS2_52180 [Heyndrickxia sporothermodurans]